MVPMSNAETSKCLAVNRRVVGSSPTSGAIFRINKLDLPSYLKKYQKRAIVRDFVGDLNKYQSQS